MEKSACDNVHCPTQVHHNASSRVAIISKPSQTNLGFLCMIATSVFHMWDIKICLERGQYCAAYLLLPLLKLCSNFRNPPISGTKNHLGVFTQSKSISPQHRRKNEARCDCIILHSLISSISTIGSTMMFE